MAPEIQHRYRYSATFANGQGGTCAADWLSLEDVRRSVAATIRDPRYDPASVMVNVEVKKSRWTRQAHGTVETIFPDLWTAWAVENAINAHLDKKCLKVGENRVPGDGRIIYRTEVEYELKTHGLGAAVERAERRLAEASAFCALMRDLQQIGSQKRPC